MLVIAELPYALIIHRHTSGDTLNPANTEGTDREMPRGLRLSRSKPDSSASTSSTVHIHVGQASSNNKNTPTSN